MASEQTIYKVELEFWPVDGCDPAYLEDLCDDIAAALEERTSEIIRGVATSVSFEPQALEIDVLINAESPVELHHRMAEVFEILGEHGLPGPGSSYVERTQPEPALAGMA
jgi:hypothetical protein